MAVQKKARKRRHRDINAASAADAIGPIEKGMDVSGLSKGQFSLIELLMHILDASGPAHLNLTVWSAGESDLEKIRDLIDDGKIASVRWLVDPSFFNRKKHYSHLLPLFFGEESICCTKVHAKYITIKSETHSFVVRTSMNLNENKRLEHYDVTEGQEIFQYYSSFSDSIFESKDFDMPAAVRDRAAAERALESHMGRVKRRFDALSYKKEQMHLSYGA